MKHHRVFPAQYRHVHDAEPVRPSRAQVRDPRELERAFCINRFHYAVSTTLMFLVAMSGAMALIAPPMMVFFAFTLALSFVHWAAGDILIEAVLNDGCRRFAVPAFA